MGSGQAGKSCESSSRHRFKEEKPLAIEPTDIIWKQNNAPILESTINKSKLRQNPEGF